MPGEYAALEAHRALGAGMDVMLFSDGVPIEDEVALKRRAHRLGLLVMGPGCGTALLEGVGLGFANVVAEGPVGVVAAAGTGAQEVMVLLDRHGAGVSRCYGTGGRDLHAEVGAITALDAIDRLARDPGTEVILCVSKPPDPEVAERVLGALAGGGQAGGGLFRGRRGRVGAGGGAGRGDARGGGDTGRAQRRARGRPAARAGGRLGGARRRARPVLRRHPVQRGLGDPGPAPGRRGLERAGRAGPPGCPRAASRTGTPAWTWARRSTPAGGPIP